MARHDPVRALGGVLTAAATLALLGGGAGCDAQADRDYPGEPLFTLHGQVQGTAPLPPLEAAMLWQLGPPPSTSEQEIATRAPIETGFPATFTIRLYQPPPSGARRTLLPGEVSWARANVAAVPYGITGPAAASLPGAGNPSSGLDAEHWVLHLAADVPAGTLTAWWLGAALPAGYHLLRVTAYDFTCPCPELDACVAYLVSLGVPDDGTQDSGTARSFCYAHYRLSPAAADDLIVLPLGTYSPLPDPALPASPPPAP